MKIAIFLIYFGFASIANAQTVTVQSGEHEGFSRLVLAIPKLKNWSLTREANGYSLLISGSKPIYDVSDVYRRITNDRLARIYTDATTGSLKLMLDCNCYAMPFELRNGLLVIDIKDGQAPTGSSFEQAADGSILPPLTTAESVKPQGEPALQQALNDVDQNIPVALADAISEAARLPQGPDILEGAETAPRLGYIKEDLLWQLSKGVAEGVVNVTKSFESTTAASANQPPQSNIRIGKEIGIVPNVKWREADQMTGMGAPCISNVQLDIGAWGKEVDVIADLAPNTTSLVGEFDRPDPVTITRTIRYYLSLGFGAEARLVLNAFKVSPPDRAIWETLSHIVDLETPPGKVFSGMEACDTSAALWAILSSPEMPPPKQIVIPAVLRSFSALPTHLRRLLGPELASRFLSRNDTGTARAIRDAILRAPGVSGPPVQMLEAEIAIANGDTDSAEDLLSHLSGGAGPVSLKSTAALIQTQVGAGEEVPANVTTTAESLLQEARGGDEEPLLQAALALGYASQNRFDDAFKLVAPNSPDALPIWSVLVDRGNDEAILNWGIFDKVDQPPALSTKMIEKIARRLLDLGFPKQALDWLSDPIQDKKRQSEEVFILAAEAEMSLSNFPGALIHLEGLESEQAARIRAKVLAGMRADDAVDRLSSSGQPMEAASAAKQMRKWSELGNLQQGGVWQDAAALTSSTTPTIDRPEGQVQTSEPETYVSGPLAQTRATLAESAAARAILDQLLAEKNNSGLLN